MSPINPINGRKNALLLCKQKILEEIQYYEKSIDEFRANHKNNSYYEDEDSSDPEDYFPNAADTGPDVSQLKLQQAMLKTCLQATQELTSLTVLQSEINILVEDPQYEGEPPVMEAGTWKEVTAECRIDLVPFTIAFYMHTPDRKFAPNAYRGLQVSLIKLPHEVELNKSVLHTLTRPSDAIEVIRSYAASYRSRRTTLARLANKYGSALFMEPHSEGGFVLKCANLLEILWRLENKWSPVAPFHHRMKFDLEYMDESHIKIITQAHKQLLDPSIQTDERTLLLSKIITTCLEARGPVDSESDLESRQTETQQETEVKDKDSEVMAPPKSIPKKTKKIASKDKDVDNVAQKRSVEDDNDEGNAKKMKVIDNGNTKKKVKESDPNKKVINDKGQDVKKIPKGKENSDKNNKKTTNNSGDIEGIKKSANENADTKKKPQSSDVVKQVNRKNKQNDIINTVTEKEKINNIDENENNNNRTEKAKIAKKRKPDDLTTETNKLKNVHEKVSKKDKNIERTKENNVSHGETGPKKAKSNVNVNKSTKNNEKIEFAPEKVKTNALGEDAKKKNTNVIENEDPVKEILERNIKNTKDNEAPKKVDKKSKMSIANDKKFDVINKKISGNIDNKDSNTKPKGVEKKSKSNIASTKVLENKENAKNTDVPAKTKNADPPKSKNTEKTSVAKTKSAETKQNNVNNTKPIETNEIKNTGNTKDDQTMTKVTQKNANNIKNKDKEIIINKVAEKIVKNKPTTNFSKPEKIKNTIGIAKENITKKILPKLTVKSLRNIVHKSPTSKNALKTQKSSNTKISSGNTKMFSGSTEKENGGQSKIPQKNMLLNRENNLKKTMLRISPRQLPSKFKSITQDTNTKTMMKNTNIPRLMKKPVPKTTQ